MKSMSNMISIVGLPKFVESRVFYETYWPAIFTKEELDAAEKNPTGYIGTEKSGVKCFLLPFFDEPKNDKNLGITLDKKL